MSAAFVITMAGLASRLLGLIRDRMLASHFGAGDTLDVYYAAFRIPDLVYNLLILGALSAAFIPVFTGLISQERREEAWKLANGLLNLAILFMMAIGVLLAIIAPWLMKIITPGFPPEKIQMVVIFSRIMFLSPLLLGVSGVFGGILTSFKHFLVYSLAPIFYNLGIIIGIVFFVRWMGPVGLAWGVVLGAFLHMAIQYPAVKKTGFKHIWFIKDIFKDSNIRQVVKLMIPRTLGIAVNQINLLVITIFASTLAAGSLAIFNFAQNLQSVPLGLFGVSFAIAVFPTLATYAAKNESDNFVNAFSHTFRNILFFVIPLSVFLLVLRAQIVRVVLGAGKFDWEDTILTFQCLGIFVISLFAQSLIPLLARSFYALQNTKTPFYIGLVAEAFNIFFVLLLIDRYKIMGLAIAFSAAAIIQMVLLLFILRTKFEDLDDKNIIKSVSKVALSAFVAGVGIQLSKYFVAQMVNMETFLGVFIQLLSAVIVGAVLFIAMCYVTRLEEFFELKGSIERRIYKQKRPIADDATEVSGI
jgi:putative peptidoglycan lipid II flippase